MFESGRDRYFNDECVRLAKERDALIKKYDQKINQEYEKEKAKYKFDWKAFLFMILFIISGPLAVYLNHRMFKPDSIFSWYYYENLWDHLTKK